MTKDDFFSDIEALRACAARELVAAREAIRPAAQRLHLELQGLYLRRIDELSWFARVA